MGPPGGGRNSVTNRYLRHFSVISVTAFDNDTLGTIFSALVDWWMKRAGFGASVTKLAKPLVAASLEVYETIQRELLPTPTKSHYTFNLRDVSKVFQVLLPHGQHSGISFYPTSVLTPVFGSWLSACSPFYLAIVAHSLIECTVRHNLSLTSKHTSQFTILVASFEMLKLPSRASSCRN